MKIQEAMTTQVKSCHAGTFFSINDAVLATHHENKAGKQGVSFNDVMTTLKAICQHHHQTTSAPNQTSKFAQV